MIGAMPTQREHAIDGYIRANASKRLPDSPRPWRVMDSRDLHATKAPTTERALSGTQHRHHSTKVRWRTHRASEHLACYCGARAPSGQIQFHTGGRRCSERINLVAAPPNPWKVPNPAAQDLVKHRQPRGGSLIGVLSSAALVATFAGITSSASAANAANWKLG